MTIFPHRPQNTRSPTVTHLHVLSVYAGESREVAKCLLDLRTGELLNSQQVCKEELNGTIRIEAETGRVLFQKKITGD